MDTGLTPEMMQLANDTVDAEILKAITEYVAKKPEKIGEIDTSDIPEVTDWSQAKRGGWHVGVGGSAG